MSDQFSKITKVFKSSHNIMNLSLYFFSAKERSSFSEDAIDVSLSLFGTELVEGDACGIGTW